MNFIQKRKMQAARLKQDRINPFLSQKEKLIDIGCGNCSLLKSLKDNHPTIQGVDIHNVSLFDNIQPIVYDGETLPFKDNQFDTSLLITMLHHTPDPERIIREAMRVSNRLIIMEDIYTHQLQKHITYFTDSLVNWEFNGHPHTNKSDKEWKGLFNSLGLKLKKEEHYPFFLLFFHQVTYVLEK